MTHTNRVRVSRPIPFTIHYSPFTEKELPWNDP